MITDKLIGAGVVAIAFAAMGGVIVWQHSKNGDLREENGRLSAELSHVQAAAKQCGESVKALHAKAEEDAAKAKEDIEAARGQAAKYKSKADKILNTPASTPGNDCQSASDRVNGWINERLTP